MTYDVVLASGVQQSESIIHTNISILFSHTGYYKLLSRFRCTTQWVLVNHLCFPTLPILPFYNGFTYGNRKIGFEICKFISFFKVSSFVSFFIRSHM